MPSLRLQVDPVVIAVGKTILDRFDVIDHRQDNLQLKLVMSVSI